MDITTLADALLESPRKNIALCYKDSYAFAVALFAVLQCNMHPILLPNNQPGTIESLQENFDTVLSDMKLAIDIKNKEIFINKACIYEYEYSNKFCEKILGEKSITLYTSGSTAQPKKIIRTLDQTIKEIEVLEHTFGNLLGKMQVYSTVLHQHIYGLLFYVFWPLYFGRTINLPILTYPEDVLSLLSQDYPVILISSPSLLTRIHFTQEINQQNIIFSSGGKLENLLNKVKIKYNIFDILGSTETGGVAFRKLPDSFWSPLSTVEICLDSIDKCLRVSSPFCSQNNFVMGDAAEINADGSFKLLDRVDRIVKIEGKRCSLVEMENIAKRHNLVEDIYILTMESNRQYTVALVVLTPDGKEQLRLKEKNFINKELKEMLSQYFDPIVLPKCFRYVDVIPVNAQNKRVITEIKKLFI